MKYKTLLLLASILLLSFLLAGCGTSNASAASVSSSQPTQLQVQRVSEAMIFPPLSRTVTNTQAVQKLYKAALALPQSPESKGIVNCPMDDGLTYDLAFIQKNGDRYQMVMHASGCRSLLVNKNDMRSLPDTFVALFAKTLGMTPAQIILTPRE